LVQSMSPRFSFCDAPTDSDYPRRGMRGYPIHYSKITNDDPMITRMFSLTHPSAYDILENSVAELFSDANGTTTRGDSTKVTTWNSSVMRSQPCCSIEKLSQWRHRVAQAMAEPPSRVDQCEVSIHSWTIDTDFTLHFLIYFLETAQPEQARDLRACQDILAGRHQDVRLPARFPSPSESPLTVDPKAGFQISGRANPDT
jgi:hypothetical protein